MRLLLIFLSAVMTWTVETKSSVSLEEGSVVPYDIEVGYACTYQKGTVRKGDTATLSLTNLGGITVESVQVCVRSNKTAGAGTFTVYGNGLQVVSKSGSLKDWTGAFDNENYHAVSLLNQSVAGIEELVIRLAGTENSLYIQKYVITYSSAAPHTVTLMKGNTTYDVLKGTSVALPAGLEPYGAWEFMGWSETECWETDVAPVVYTGTYKPARDVTLWAVYQKDVTPTLPNVVDLEDGAYMYFNTSSYMAMSGGVANGVAGAEAFDPYSTSQEYEITFNADGRATIKLMYVYGDAYIGYNGTSLADKPSQWDVYHEGDKTVFYTTVGNEKYVLFPGKMFAVTQDEYYFVTDMVVVNNIETTPTALRTTDMPAPMYIYTCHPEAEGFELPNEGMKELTREWVIPFGNYELHIRNGRKSLRLNE